MSVTKYSPGSIVARRFEIQSFAGRGGMGEVYKARDQESGEVVALKLICEDATAQDVERFAREARILSEISHPGIVSYVAHGASEESCQFLAMQWLEGEDLAKRLARGPLSTGEALTLLKRIAEALSAMHERGLVHRDLKPSNVMLVSRELTHATLLDLGLARPAGLSSNITAMGRTIGTFGYMAPEQVHNEGPLEPSADVFSLGCILFECLTGQRPFASPDPVRAMSKILSEEAPRIASLRPGVPKEVEELAQRMLGKDPKKRPASAKEVAQQILALGNVALGQTGRGAFAPTIARETPELASVVVVMVPAPEAPEQAIERRAAGRLISDELERRGARMHGREGAEIVATFARQSDVAMDQAALAASATLRIARRWPFVVVAVATGLVRLDGETPAGNAVDRARAAARASDAARGVVVADALTASLVGSRFQTNEVGGSIRLEEDTSAPFAVRPLLGKVMPVLGREAELGLLLSTFAACKEGSGARATLMTAPPGVGKTRLAQELLRRLGEQGEDALILYARGEALLWSATYGVIRGLMRGASGDAPKSDARAREAFADGPLARAQIERVFLDFLEAESAKRPTFIVIDDVHLSDPPSVKLVERALSDLAERPVFVLALGRPETIDVFPGLFADRADRLRLPALGRRAAAELAREALGALANEAVIARIVERAAGNPFYLGELVRTHASNPNEPPPSLLAMLQARFGALSWEARRMLIAASVFGERFSRSGVLAVLDEEGEGPGVDAALEALVEAELVARHRAAAREEELGFAHALVREAAYAMLGEDDLVVGHARAAAFLEARGGEALPLLAEHWQRGGDASRATTLHVRAAREAFERSDPFGALTHAAKAEELGAEGAELGLVRAIACCASFWSRSWAKGYELGWSALPLLPRGSAWHCRVLGALCVATCVGSVEAAALPALVDDLVETNPDEEALSAYAVSLGRLVVLLAMWRDRAMARRVMARMRETVYTRGAVDPATHGWARLAAYKFDRTTTNEPLSHLETIEDATRAFEETGDERMVTLCLSRVGEAHAALGANEEAEAKLREAEARAERLGEAHAVVSARVLLAAFLAEREASEARDEARRLAAAIIAGPSSLTDDVGLARGLLAQIALGEGNLAEAEAEVLAGLGLIDELAVRRIPLTATRIRVLSRSGRVAEARSLARETLARVEQAGGVGAWEITLRSAAAEAFLAAGDKAAFEAEIRAGLLSLGMALGDVVDLPGQTRLLREVPANVLLLNMARAHFGEMMVREFLGD